jgi:hypothetical protein
MQRRLFYPFLRLSYAIMDYPQRLLRLWRHLLGLRIYQVIPWVQDFGFLLSDLFFVLDLWDIGCSIAKIRSRHLNLEEQDLASFVFGDAIRQNLVLIDEKAYLGPTRNGVVYVSGFSINAYKSISAALLVHELVHIWQYQQQGAAYIPRALRAQFSQEGYNYGGLQALRKSPQLRGYNLEQQADIVMDYFLLSQGYRTQWAPEAQFSDLPLYEAFIQQIRQNEW